MGDSVKFGPLRENGWKMEAVPNTATPPAFADGGCSFVRFAADGTLLAMTAAQTTVFGWARIGFSPGNLLVNQSTGIFTADPNYELPVLVDPGSVVYECPTDIPYVKATHYGRIAPLSVASSKQLINLTGLGGAGSIFKIIDGDEGENVVRVVVVHSALQVAP